MTTAIADAVAAGFADPNMAVDGSFEPAAGGSVAVRVIWRRPDETVLLPTAGLKTPLRIAEIEAAKVATPLEGDVLRIDGDARAYPVLAVNQPDMDRLIWRLSLGKPS